MQPVTLHFSPDLHVFLLPQQRGAAVPFPLVECAPVKHPVEALGVPHTEVDAVTVNGHGVTLDHRLWGGERVHVYSRLDLGADSPLAHLLPPVRPALPRPPRFVLDTHLGRLAAHLRLFGFDTLYRNDYDDDLLAAIAAAEQRVLLTRDRGLLKRRIVVYGHWVRDTRLRRQLLDVMRRYALAPLVAPWTRCARCNGLLTPVAKAEVMPQLEPKTKLYYENFQRCAVCGQVFWQGSHFARMQNFVDGVLAEVAAAPLPGSPTGA
ncbi:MAG: Mut7-C RNAse domain-containing protein [Caldilineaceae bacterium]